MTDYVQMKIQVVALCSCAIRLHVASLLLHLRQDLHWPAIRSDLRSSRIRQGGSDAYCNSGARSRICPELATANLFLFDRATHV